MSNIIMYIVYNDDFDNLKFSDCSCAK